MEKDFLARLASELKLKGTVMLTGNERFLTESEFDSLEETAESLPRELVTEGDSGEPNSVEVARFMTDIDKPKIVNASISKIGIDIVSNQEKKDFYKNVLQINGEVFIRRMQYNIMREGSFVGYHLDTDSNPDYLIAIVIQFGKEFEGGNYVVYGGDMPPRNFMPSNRSIILSHCNFPHEVTRVNSGVRKSLVYFVSQNSDKNKRVPGTSLYERREALD